MTKIWKVCKLNVLVFALVFLLSGCNGEIPSLSDVNDVEVYVGSEMPDFLQNVDLVDVEETDVIIDSSNVDMDVIGDYEVTYTLPSDNDEENTYTLTVHVIAYDGYYAPVISGVKNLTYVIGEDMPDLMDGVSAMDSEYGDMTHRVNVTNDIDYNMPGTYEVRYQVENIDGYSTYEVTFAEVVYDESVFELPEQFLIVYQDGFSGVKSITGEDVVPIEYDNVYFVGSNMMVLEKNNSTYFYNVETEEYISYEYDLVTPFIDGLAVVRDSFEYSGFDYDSVYHGPYLLKEPGYDEDSFYSYMNIDGEVIFPFIYSNASIFMDDRALVRVGDNTGVIDKTGNEIITIKYDSVSTYPNGHFVTSLNGEYILVDGDGSAVMELSRSWYNTRSTYDEQTIYTVEINGNAAVLDENLNLILQTDYQSITIWQEYYSSDDTFYAWGYEGYGAIYSAKGGLMVDKVIQYTLLDEDVLFSTMRGWGLYDLVQNKVGIEPMYASLQALYGSGNLLIAENETGEIAVVTNLNHVQDDFFVGSIDNMNYSGFFEDGFYRYTDDLGYYGLLDLSGKDVTNGTYKYIDRFYDGYALVQDKVTNRWNFIDEDGLLLFSTNVINARKFENGVARVQVIVDQKGWQLINTNAEALTDEFYYTIDPFTDGVAYVRKDVLHTASPFNFINEQGEELSAVNFNGMEQFHEGYAAIRFTSDEDSWGLVSGSGEVILQGNFKSVGYVHDGVVRVFVDGMYSFYNTDGDKAIEADFEYATSFSNGCSIVRDTIDGVYHYKVMDLMGTVIYDSGTTRVYEYNNGLALTFDEDGYAMYLDTGGDAAFKTDYKYEYHFSGGIAMYRNPYTGKIGYMNTYGEEITEAIFTPTYSSNFTDDSAFATVKVGTDTYNWGIMDKAGNMVVEPNYSIQFDETESTYKVTDNNSNITYWKVDGDTLSTDILNVDEFGNSRQKVYVYSTGWEIRNGNSVLVSGDYDDIEYNRFNQTYTTYLDGKMGMVSKTGVEILKPLYSHIDYSIGDEYILAGISRGEWNIVNIGAFTLEGDVIVPAQYDEVYYDQRHDLFIVENGSLLGCYDTEGTIILDVEYYHAEYIDTLAIEPDMYYGIPK